MAPKIAILGGGVSSLVTAFELTKLRAGQDPYFDIMVYQQGWRLGGKGASGRSCDPEQRIEEHGLHVLFGAYENAFRVIREVYEGDFRLAIEEANALRSTDRPPLRPLSRREAFKGHNFIAMYERTSTVGPGVDTPWVVDAPERSGEPGDGTRTSLGPANIVRLILSWVRHWIERENDAAAPNRLLPIPAGFSRILRYAEDIGRSAASAAPGAPLAYTVLLERMVESAATEQSLRRWLEGGRPAGSLRLLRRMLNAMAGVTRRAVGLIRSDQVGTTLRRNQVGVDFGLTVLSGLLADGVIGERQNWFAIDEWDLRDWLRRHGAAPETVDSALVDGLYMAAFSAKHPLGAGTILHALIRGAHYKGHVFYRMQGGMGDIIFVPLYLALLRRGVKFRFFHRVHSIEASPSGGTVAAVRIEDQAPRSPGYQPLVEVDSDGRCIPCWPSAPVLDRLHPEDRARWTGHDPENWWRQPTGGRFFELRARPHGTIRPPGENEFDALVLGIGVGAHDEVASSLMSRSARYGTMVRSLVTTPTQAAQLWFRRTRSEMGWTYQSPAAQQPMVIPFVGIFDTCADMSHLIPWENCDDVKTLVYICTSLAEPAPQPPAPHPAYTDLLRQAVRSNLEQWLSERACDLWPGLERYPRIVDALAVPDLDRQHLIAIVHPSDRYVLAVPGSNRWRLRADESGFSNLYLTGDWTRTALSVGCVEAATMSAIQTARAVMTGLGVSAVMRDRLVPKAHFDWLPDAR